MITEHEIFLTDPSEKAKVIEFLKGFDLTFTGNIDYTMGLYDDGQLIGTGSLGAVSCGILPSARNIRRRG